MNAACTKNGSSPLASNHSVTAWPTNLVWERWAGNRAGAHVGPWSSEPGKSGIGSYSSWGSEGTSKPWAASQDPQAGLPCSQGSWTTARNPGRTLS